MSETKTNLVTSFEEACKVKGLDPEKTLPDVTAYPEEHRKPLIALAKLLIITDVVREGHLFDYNNYDDEKWYPWWYLRKDATNPSGFRLDGAFFAGTNSIVGARLCLRSEEEVNHMVEHFSDLYRAYITQ